MAGVSITTVTADISAVTSGSKVQDPIIREALNAVKTTLTDLNTRTVSFVATFTGTAGTAEADLETLRKALVSAGVIRASGVN